MTEVVQPLFLVSRGYAKVNLSSHATSFGALWTYKALLIELSKRNLLKNAQESRVWLKPASEAWIYDSTQGSGCSLPEMLKNLSAVRLKYSLETDPPRIGFTSLVTGYVAEISGDPDAHASWVAGIDLPSSLLAYVILRIAERRDWIQTEMYPALPSQPFQMPLWPADLQMSCAAR